MSLLASPLFKWAALILALAGLIVAGIVATRSILDGQQAAGAASEKAAIANQRARDVEAARAADQAIAYRQQESDRAPDTYLARAAAAQPGVGAAVDRLFDRADTFNGCGVPGGTAASAVGPAASSAADMRTELRRRAREALGQLTGFADSAHGAGLKAEGRYDALSASTPLKGSP